MRHALIALLLAAPAGAVPFTDIGVAAAVRGAVKAMAPGAPVGRVIQSGKPIYLNDHVTTDAGGRLQILLLDETTFTVGPNSDMVLDEFVYDPKTNAGKVSARIDKGTFRFVTGKVARRDAGDMKVKLPVGTIGIRGTMVEGIVDGKSASVALVGPGPDNNANEPAGGITVSNEKGSVDIDRSGYMTTIAQGEAPTPPAPATAQFLEQTGAASGSGGSGGGGSGSGSSSDGDSQGASNGSATDASGQSAAAGGDSAQTVSQQVGSGQGQTTTFAAQDFTANSGNGLANGLASWDQILAIPSGAGQYTGNGSYTCTSGCAGSGSVSLSLVIDFQNQTIGGNFSQLSLSGPLSATTGINSISYASNSGPASLNLAGYFSDVSFTGGTLNLNNKDGKVAAESVLTFSYSTGGNAASGGVTGSIAPYTIPQ